MEELIINPNCSETVVRLKIKGLDKLSERDKKLYQKILYDDGSHYCEYSLGDEYSSLRGDNKWKAHYFWMTTANDLIAFALWKGVEFDSQVWHTEDIFSWMEDGKIEDVKEYLSEMFTYFENYE